MSFSNHPFFRFSPLAFLCLLLLTGAEAQTYSISGKITDAISREAIPFAGISLKGKSIGTTSDFEGNFTLHANVLSDSIVATSIGYLAVSKPLKNLPNQTVNFILERAEISLEEIVVRPAEDPAIALFRKIIKNKTRNSSNKLNNYGCEAYNKVELDLYDWDEKFQDRRVMRPFQFVFDRIDSITEDKPFLPVFLSESLSDYYYRSKPQKEEREVVFASKQSGVENESFSQFLGSMYQEVSVYDNWPSLFYKSFVSPLNDNGLSYYKYTLADSGFIDGVYCYQMTFAPKTKNAFTFAGDMWIADSSYALKQVSMEASSHVNINFIDKMSFFQQFDLVNDSSWMLSKDKLVIRFKVTDNMLGFIGRKTASYKDFKVDLPDMDKNFETRTDIVVDEKAFEKPDSFWTSKRHEDLTLNESGVYAMVDSLKNTKAFNNWLDVANMVLTGYYPVSYVEFGPIASSISFNDIETVRFRMGVRTSAKFSKKIRLGVYGAYGIEDKRFKYGADILYMINNDPRQMLGAEYFHDLDLRATNVAQFSQDNFLTGLIRRNVPFKLSFVNQWSAFYEKEWKVGYSNRITLRYRDIQPEFNFQYLKDNDNAHTDTVNSIVVAEALVKLRFAYREKFIAGDFNRVSLGTRYPTLVALYTLGVKNILGSEYTYHKIEVALDDQFPVNPIGTFYLTFVAGKTFGTLPYMLLNDQPGNETFFYNRYAFNLMNRYEFITDLYFALHLHHHFEGYFLNKIPWVRKLKLREIIFANAVIGTMSSKNKEANGLGTLNEFIVPYPKPYVDVGFGFENILKLIEVDFMWRLTYLDAPYAPKWAPMFGMKLAF